MSRFEPTPVNAPVPTPNPLGIFPPPPVPIIPKPRTYSSVAQGGLPTLQALQQRAQEIQAPQMGEIRDPLQGASFLANTLVSNLTKGALMNQEQQQRAKLAEIAGGALGAPGGPTAEQVQQAMAIDPEGMGSFLYKQALAARNQEKWEPVPGQPGLYRNTVTGEPKFVDTSGKDAWKPSDIGSLRDDYTKAATVYNTASPSWQSMKEAAALGLAPEGTVAGKGAADYNMIVAFAKLLDPNSVVREGEVKSAQMTEGDLGLLQGYLNTWKKEGSLTDDARRGIMTQANSRMKAYYDQANAAKTSVTDIATRHQIDPRDVVLQPLPPAFEGWSPEPPPDTNKPPPPPPDNTGLPSIAHGDVDGYNKLPDGAQYTVPGDLTDGKPTVYTKKAKK